MVLDAHLHNRMHAESNIGGGRATGQAHGGGAGPQTTFVSTGKGDDSSGGLYVIGLVLLGVLLLAFGMFSLSNGNGQRQGQWDKNKHELDMAKENKNQADHKTLEQRLQETENKKLEICLSKGGSMCGDGEKKGWW